jgi:hypothetical protein
MSGMLYIAALLSVVLGLAHSVLGERYFFGRLFRSMKLSRFMTGVLRLAWHVTTLAWFGFAALIVQLAQGSLTTSATARTIGWTFIASGVLSVAFTRGKHVSWLILFSIGGLSLLWSFL